MSILPKPKNQYCQTCKFEIKKLNTFHCLVFRDNGNSKVDVEPSLTWSRLFVYISSRRNRPLYYSVTGPFLSNVPQTPIFLVSIFKRHQLHSLTPILFLTLPVMSRSYLSVTWPIIVTFSTTVIEPQKFVDMNTST